MTRKSLKSNNNMICKDCIYMSYDVLANARCAHPETDGHAPIISEYSSSCFKFKSK